MNDSAQELKSFYMKLREREHSCDSTAVTARQLESLIRLSEARAKVELRETVTRQDAVEVIELMNASLFDKPMDDRGFADLTGCGRKSSKRAPLFLCSVSSVSFGMVSKGSSLVQKRRGREIYS